MKNIYLLKINNRNAGKCLLGQRDKFQIQEIGDECDKEISRQSKIIVSICSQCVNPFHANIPFLYSPSPPKKKKNKKYQKNKGFLTFSGGIEMGHCREKG